MHQVSQVSAQRLKLIEDYLWSPHSCITDNVAGVTHHSMFMLFIQVSRGIPGQGLRGQVQSQIVMAVKFIVVLLTLSTEVTPLRINGRMTGCKGLLGSVKVNACI